MNELFINASERQKSQSCKITKIGGLNRSKKVIRIGDKRANLESQFIAIAKKANRSEAQRELRRLKR